MMDDDARFALLRQFLRANEAYLREEVTARPGARAAAREYARKWAGPGLADELAGPGLLPAGDRGEPGRPVREGQMRGWLRRRFGRA